MLEEKKKIKAHTPFSKGLRKGCAILIAVILIFSLLCVPVSAKQNSNNTFIMSCGRPAVGNGKGYVEFLLKNRETGTYNVRVVSWCAYPISNILTEAFYDTLADIAPEIYFSTSNTEDYLRITSGNLDDVQWGIYSVNSWSQSFDVYTLKEGDNNVYFRTSTNEIVSFHIYGSYYLRSRGGVENEEFYVLYAEDGAIYNAIQNGQQNQTNQIIQGQQEQTDDITSNQDSNTNKITANQNSNANKITANQNSNTDKVTSNQDKNTQSIIDNQNQLVENEKNEANTSGDKGVGDVLEVVPTETDGLLTAFGKLTDTMTTTEITNCNIKIPTLKIPEISPFFNEKVLLNEQTIDLHDYVVLIPEDILKLLQNIFTIALIIYCFKELYSTISYVMTLRKDNDNE